MPAPAPVTTHPVLCALLTCLLVAAMAAVAAARPDSSASADERIVARVGPRTITVGEMEERLRAVPPFQLQVLGDTPDEIRRAFLDQLVEEELLVQAARADGLHQVGGVKGRIRAVMRAAMLANVRLESGDGRDLSEEEVARYYREHEEQYRRETLLKLWQIVVPTRDQAAQILETIRTDPGYRKDPVKGWKALVDKYSVDLATKQHDGDLGFVRKDGTTKRPNVRAAPAIFEAAAKVKDGEVVPAPVPVGGAFAVVQRRGSRQTPKRTVETEGPNIRRRLAQEKYEQSVAELLRELRQSRVHEKHPQRVDVLTVSVPHGEVVPVRRPGGLDRARHPSARSPQPLGQPGQLR